MKPFVRRSCRGNRGTTAAHSIAGVAVAAVLVLVPASPAAAAVTATVAETGWWSQRPGATAQDDGGFEVAAALGTEQSVAALRIQVSGGQVTTATLTIEETGGVGQSEAPLTVCPTAVPWTAANPGAYSEAPEPDCTRTVELTRAADGASWTADVGILLGEGETSLVVVPGTGGPGGLPLGPGYQVTFGAATVQAAGADGAGGGLAAPEPEGIAPPGAGGDDLGGGEFDSAPAPGADSPSFATPGVDPAFDASTPPPEPAAAAPGLPQGGADDAASTGPPAEQPVGAVSSFASGPVSSDGGGNQPWGRLLFLVPLCALAGAGVAYGRPWLRAHDFGRFLPG